MVKRIGISKLAWIYSPSKERLFRRLRAHEEVTTYDVELSELGLVPIILIGYERSRHLYGLKELAKRGISRVYILYDNVHESWKEIAQSNASKLRDSVATFFDVELMGWNPQEFVDAIRVFTYILKNEQNNRLMFDFTNTTEEAFLASALFCVTFGTGAYYVAPSEYSSFNERITRTFNLLKKDEDLLVRYRSYRDRSQVDSFTNLIDILKPKYLELVRREYEERPPGKVKELPSTPPRVRLEELHENIILALKTPADSIAELTIRLGAVTKKTDDAARARAQARVNHYLAQIEKWGFVDTIRSRRTRISLTDFGQGYELGLEQFLKKKESIAPKQTRPLQMLQ